MLLGKVAKSDSHRSKRVTADEYCGRCRLSGGAVDAAAVAEASAAAAIVLYVVFCGTCDCVCDCAL